jgi:hypothetical protein
MAFIDKKDPVVLNIKLTSKGRELLAKGLLNFKYFIIGDSEIDYEFNGSKNDDDYINPFYSNILRPADKNPNIISFITKNLSGDKYNTISSIPVTPTKISNTIQPLGFFNISNNSTNFLTDTDHVKQPDVMIEISGVTGGTIISGITYNFLKLKKSPTYVANVNEPTIGDLILVKWTNPYGINTTGYTVNINSPTPYIIYKIQEIVSGKLSTDNLKIIVDRELPNFTGITGGSNTIVAGALIYYNYLNFTGETAYTNYSTDFVDESVLSFLQNCQCPTITFPFWNMSIIYTDEIIGVQNDNKTFKSFNSNAYGGFVSYIQNQAKNDVNYKKKLGVIHYSNSSPSNTYAEEFSMVNATKLPTLYLPTIMWHKSTGSTMGLILKPTGSVKLVTGATTSLNTPYYDLVDESGNVVGKIFNDLKIFVIEDQELLFAMSYKSNRSWTLPDYTVGVNDNILVGCLDCTIDYLTGVTIPTKISYADAKLYISGITGTIPVDEGDSILILSVSGTSGYVYFHPITGDTIVTGLTSGNYEIMLYDTAAANCPVKLITILNPTSYLNFTSVLRNPIDLNPDFGINYVTTPTNIRVLYNDIGKIYGKALIAVAPYSEISAAPVSSSSSWKTFPTIGYASWTTELVYKNSYSFYLRDSGTTAGTFTIKKDYVLIPNPFNSAFTVSGQLVDAGGKYVRVTNYKNTDYLTIIPSVVIAEISIYKSNSVPVVWETVVSSNSQKIYPKDGAGIYKIALRVRKNKITQFVTTYSNTIIIT